MSPRRRLFISISVLLLVQMTGTAGFMVLEHQPFLDSLYMTVITLSTVGYNEVFPLDDSGRILTICIIIVGYSAVAISIANLVSIVVGGELRSHRERLRMKDRIHKLRGHTIICGYGRMGSNIALQLVREDVDCVILDPIMSEEIEERGMLHVQGDATDDYDLEEAGIQYASSLVTCLSSDADNVYVTLSARGLCPTLKIIARAEQKSTEAKLKRAGADAVISPQTIGANKAVGLLRRPHVVDFADMAAKGVDIEIAQYQVDDQSSLAGKALKDSAIRERADVMVVAIKRADGRQVFGPGPQEVIDVDDQLIVIGRGGLSDRLERLSI
ncbi:MAG: potassium transporter TrkA [Phycisphaerae bacterium]|nr:MAG: potassium transporter TrkA [Phycisphaerae bacterium]